MKNNEAKTRGRLHFDERHHMHDGIEKPKRLSEIPSYLKKKVGGFFKRLFYIVSLVWATSPWLLLAMIALCLLDGISPVLGALVSKELLNGELAAKDIIQETPYQNLSVIPANTLLTSAEFELFDFEDSEFRMKTALAEVKDNYDYILIDCPPSLGRLTVNALTASDGVIVPMQCEFYALEGLSQLMITVKLIKKHYNPDLNVSGILLTMHNARLLLSMQVVNELKKHYEDKLFETKISRNVKLSEAPSFGMPVYYHDKNAKGTKEYLEVAKELATRI